MCDWLEVKMVTGRKRMKSSRKWLGWGMVGPGQRGGTGIWAQQSSLPPYPGLQEETQDTHTQDAHTHTSFVSTQESCVR